MNSDFNTLGPFSVYDIFPSGRRPLKPLTLNNISFLRVNSAPAGLDNLRDIAIAPTSEIRDIALRWRALLSVFVTVDGAGAYHFVPTMSQYASELILAHCSLRGIRPQHKDRLTFLIQGMSSHYGWPGPDSESQEHFVLYAEDGRGGDPLEFKVESMQLTSLHYSYYAFWTYSVLLWMREVNRVYPAEEGQPRGLDFYVAKYKSLYPHQRAQDERVDDTYGPKTHSVQVWSALAIAGSMRTFRTRVREEGLVTRQQLNKLIGDIRHLRKNGYLQRASSPSGVEQRDPPIDENETPRRNLSHSGPDHQISGISNDKLLSIPLVFFDIPDIASIDGIEWTCPSPVEPCKYRVRLPAKTQEIGPSNDIRLLQFREEVANHMWRHIGDLGVDLNPFIEANEAIAATTGE